MFHRMRGVAVPAVAVWISFLVFEAGSVLAAPAKVTESTPARPVLVELGRESVLTSNHTATALLARESAGPDTFDLLGGAGSLTGRFSDPTGTVPDRQGWIGIDVTDVPPDWNASTFNAANLGGHGAGNQAFWCGREASGVSGWSTPPGYGNRWDAIALYESEPVADPSTGQDVALDFLFNHDSEPGFDFFHVEYEKAGIWVQVLNLDGTNKSLGEFPAPGVSFSDVATGVVHFDGNDYGAGDRIRIRFRFASDGGWSDEDGLWPTDGAVQIDDLSITHSGGSFTEDFEGAGPYLVEAERQPFAGDFSDVYSRFTDIDPCVENTTPVIGFIDYGQAPPNGPGVDGTVSTGGSLSPTWDYGIPGGFVVNYTGGLSNGLVPIHNFVASPELDWDLPGSDDDGPDVVGARFDVSVWAHGTLGSPMFMEWQVRSRSAGSEWGEWRDRGFLYYGAGNGAWRRLSVDVTDLLEPDPEQVQLRLGVNDLSASTDFGFLDSTPAPVFDDVRFSKYRIGGPALTARAIDCAQSGFPTSGSIAASTPAERDALDIPFSMARDINTNDLINTAGDSIIVDVSAVIPGTSVADIRMKWALRKNGYFEDAIRSAPARVKDENVSAVGPIWTGEVVAETAKTSAGVVVAGRFFVDVPDVDFIYPGDQFQYYIEATDSDGRVSTFPTDTTGFGVWDAFGVSGYNRQFVVRGLPTITASGQPSKLLYNDAADRGNVDEFNIMMNQLGFTEGIDYDIYETQGPSSGVGNGIGSAGVHGATPEQLAGYDTIVVDWASLTAYNLSNGDGAAFGDKGNDVGTMEGWKNLPGQRNTVYFGDFVAYGMVPAPQGNGSPEAQAYLETVMGVQFNDRDARDEIGNQTAPRVQGLLPAFDTQFVAYGGCPVINEFDSISPRAGAVAGHAFLSSGGVPFASPAASVVYDRLDAGDRKVDITFPYGTQYVYRDLNGAGSGLSALTDLMSDVFTYLGVPATGSGDVDAPAIRTASLSLAPNPFNPRTVVKFAVAVRAPATVRVYNLRGELVRTLHEGVLDVGEHPFVWNGEDDAGRAVSSGVYLVNAVTSGFEGTRKAVVLK